MSSCSHQITLMFGVLYICLSYTLFVIAFILLFDIVSARTHRQMHTESFSFTRICTSINFLCAIQIHC